MKSLLHRRDQLRDETANLLFDACFVAVQPFNQPLRYLVASHAEPSYVDVGGSRHVPVVVGNVEASSLLLEFELAVFDVGSDVEAQPDGFPVPDDDVNRAGRGGVVSANNRRAANSQNCLPHADLHVQSIFLIRVQTHSKQIC